MSTRPLYHHCECGLFLMVTAHNYKFKSWGGVIHTLADCTQPDTVTSGQGPKEPQTGDDQLAELRLVANEGSTASECSGADLRALIARLDAAEAKCADYQRQAFGEPPSDTVTITISREDADYFATDLPASWEEPSVRLKDACRAALREDGPSLGADGEAIESILREDG